MPSGDCHLSKDAVGDSIAEMLLKAGQLDSRFEFDILTLCLGR